MRLRLRTLLLPLLIALCGCDSITGPDPGEQLVDARKKWLREGPSSYVITIHRSCGECPPGSIGPVDVWVDHGTVVQRTYVADGKPVASAEQLLFPPVIELFLVVQGLQQTKPYKLDVKYDSELGFPTSITVDLDKKTVDDEFGIYVVGFHAQ
jgi:hypothetical protein